jgi:beta-lactamase regulating signal transducer with metallopeptidase domain
MIAHLEAALAEVWRLSWQASTLIALVLLAQWIGGGRWPARWRYNLWLLVLVRLVLPWSWPSPLSVYNVVHWGSEKAATVLEATAPARASAVRTPEVAARPVEEVVPSETIELERLAPVFDEQARLPLAPAVLQPRTALPAATVRVSWPWRKILAVGWALGALALSAQVVFTTWRMLWRMRESTPVSDPALLALLEGCRGLMGVARAPSLRESSAVKSPALVGFLRPHLLLPRGLAGSFSVPELRHIFLHELAHVRRRDLPLNWLITVLQVLHWFNPVIWFGMARLRADRELACDALAIERNGGEPAREYGRTILKLLESAAVPATAPGMIGILESKHQMVRRIRMIAQFRGAQRWPLLAMGLTAALALAGLTDAARTVRAAVEKITAPEKTVRVTVLDAATGQPIPEAAVYFPFGPGMMISELPPAPPRTDAAGVALLPSEARSGVLVRHPGYAPAVWGRNQYRNTPESTIPSEFTLRLVRGETIAGLVRNEGGTPLAGVRVEITGTSGRPKEDAGDYVQTPEHPLPYCPSVETNAEGRWQSEHFPVDVAMVQLRFHRSDGSTVTFHSKIPPGYAGLGGEAEEISVEEARGRRLVTVLPAGTEVRGLALDAAGKPLAGVTVTEQNKRWNRPPWSTKTDADGRFKLAHRDPHQILLALSRDGLATEFRVVNIAPGLPEQVFRLAPARPLKVRVVDEAGRPISKAMIAPPELALGWTGTTDANGKVSWPAAPVEGAVLAVSAEKYRSRILRIVPAEQELSLTLRSGGEEGHQVTIRPLGSDGKPLSRFSVFAAYHEDSIVAFEKFEPLAEGRDGVCSVVVPAAKAKQQEFRLKVEAPGHAPWLSDTVFVYDGEPVLTPTLSAAAPAVTGEFAGQVLLPDGKPAAHASVILTHGEGERTNVMVSLWGRGTIMRVETRNATPVHADGDGKFTLPMAAPETPVLVYHAQGLVTTTVSEIVGKPEVRLKPWGVVEGKLLVNGQPRAGQRINLTPAHVERRYDLWYAPNTETDKDGNFRIDQAPPGEGRLTVSRMVEGQSPRSYETPVMVKSGDVTHADCIGNGPTVTGRVRLDKADAELDWRKDLGTALLKTSLSHSTGTSPSYEDFVLQREFLVQMFKPRHAAGRGYSTYALDFAPDGSFRSEAVPPGKYELELKAVRHNSTKNRNDTTDIGALELDVVVPAGDANSTIDLGNLTLALTGEARPKTPPLALTARTLDGQPVSLASLAGKQVLLLFWATWAPPSAETLAQWQRLYEAHGTDPRFTMLGISLDKDAAKAQQFADAHEWHWPQARLEGGEMAAVTERLAVDTLPAALLLGPDARLALRDATEAQLRAAIDAFLAPPK